jgi:O-antigen/teichoic acid export membrane protein
VKSAAFSIRKALRDAARLLTSPSRLLEYIKDPLHRNSSFLMAGEYGDHLLGFFFWLLAAREYSDQDYGSAATIISTGMLVAMLSLLGFNIALVRFLPREEDKTAMINTCYTVSGLLSITMAAAFLGICLWIPDLSFLHDNTVYLAAFLLLAGAESVYRLQLRTFVAFRAAHFALIQTLIRGSRLALVVLLIGIGDDGLGIVLGWAIAACAALIVMIPVISRLHPGYRPIPVIHKKPIRDMLPFSFGNYIGEILAVLPRLLFPLIIVVMLDTEMSGYFYTAWTISSVATIISGATTFSLLAEASYTQRKLSREVIRATQFIFLLLVPAVTGIFLFGDVILSLFGSEYSENGLHLLWLLAIASVPFAFVKLYVTVSRIQERVRPVIYAYGFIALFTIGIGSILMKDMGLPGIGIAWLAANGIVAVISVPIMLNLSGISMKGLLKGLVGADVQEEESKAPDSRGEETQERWQNT